MLERVERFDELTDHDGEPKFLAIVPIRNQGASYAGELCICLLLALALLMHSVEAGSTRTISG